MPPASFRSLLFQRQPVARKPFPLGEHESRHKATVPAACHPATSSSMPPRSITHDFSPVLTSCPSSPSLPIYLPPYKHKTLGIYIDPQHGPDTRLHHVRPFPNRVPACHPTKSAHHTQPLLEIATAHLPRATLELDYATDNIRRHLRIHHARAPSRNPPGAHPHVILPSSSFPCYGLTLRDESLPTGLQPTIPMEACPVSYPRLPA